MKQPQYISSDEVETRLSWTGLCDALRRGHSLPRAKLGDVLLQEGSNGLLSRAAWVEGLGLGVKTATVFPDNAKSGGPSVQSVMTLFDPKDGRPSWLIDGNLVTKWKTAGDSILGAALLARPDSRHLVIIGAGAVGESLLQAYPAVFPRLERVTIWNRSPQRAKTLAQQYDTNDRPVIAVDELSAAVADADIVSCATMTTEPVLMGDWVREGTHVDLIGAFRPDMREADDTLMAKAEVFVDARETTVEHIGELIEPIRQGVITERDVLGDLYDLCIGRSSRSSEQAITVFKNGGGAHLDVMTADYIRQTYEMSGAG